MRKSFFIIVAMALGGLIFNRFSSSSLLAFLYISISASPLLLFSIGLSEPGVQGVRIPSLGSAIPVVVLVVAALAPLAIIRSQGFSPGDAFSVEVIAAVAGQVTVDRYILGSMGENPFLVAATFINAFIWPMVTTRILTSVGLGLLPAAAYAIVTTAKWPLYCAMSFFLTALLLRVHSRPGSGRAALRLSPVVLLAAAGGVLAIAARQGVTDVAGLIDSLGDISFLFAHYLFAQYEAFGLWLSGNFAYCCDFGRWSLSGPMDYVGLAPRLQGVFESNVQVYGEETNIYTGWRYLIQDFSLIGPLAILLLTSAGYRAAVIGGFLRLAAGIEVMLILSAFIQISATLGLHNSVLLAAVCSSGWVSIAGRIEQARGLHGVRTREEVVAT